MSIRMFLLAVALVFQFIPALADDGGAARSGAQQTKEASGEAARRDWPEKEPSVTHHTVTIGGKPVGYSATAGTLRLKSEAGKSLADMFFVAYTREGEDTSRPIMFLFNGGPGAASIWLHMGAAGPRRVMIPEAEKPGPAKIVENAQTWLAFADLVFVDPVGTGFSRALPGEDERQFFGTREDIESVGAFIRLYLTKYGRWLSPLFLAGESYGTYRAAGLADHLYERYGMNVNGLVLISLAINFQTFSFELGNDLPYVAFLPTYAASAWYHKKLPPEQQEKSLQEILEEVERWALDEYVPALARGSLLAGDARERTVDALVRYTGLSREALESRDLRVGRSDFMRELLRSENRSPGLMDGRATTQSGASEDFMSDPSIVATVSAYTPAINDYIRRDLKFETGLPYVFLSDEANSRWNWGKGLRVHVNLLDRLQKTMNRNRKLRIYAASGLYDLDTPYFGTVYSLNHLGLEPSMRDNIRTGFFEGGHMLYLDARSLEKLTADVMEMMKSAL